MSFRYAAPIAERYNPHRRVYGTCCECKTFFGQGLLNDHMVQEHGYIREGGQVFKRISCQFGECKAPGLYRVGIHIACKPHLEQLKKLAARRLGIIDRDTYSVVDANLQMRDKQLRASPSTRAKK